MPKDQTGIDGANLIDVIGEIESGVPMKSSQIAVFDPACTWCLQAYRVKLLQLFLSSDRKRAMLIFRAPDVESVRMACRRAAMPMARVWACAPPKQTDTGPS